MRQHRMLPPQGFLPPEPCRAHEFDDVGFCKHCNASSPERIEQQAITQARFEFRAAVNNVALQLFSGVIDRPHASLDKESLTKLATDCQDVARAWVERINDMEPGDKLRARIVEEIKREQVFGGFGSLVGAYPQAGLIGRGVG